MKQYVANSLEDLCMYIQEIKLSEETTLWYRGHSDLLWDLVPSIQRNGIERKEQIITHSFYHSVSQVSDENISITYYDKWITKMQHYGLPTRLLDWSYSPLIAIYFATIIPYSECKNDACIWILLPSKLNNSQGFGNYIYPIDSHTAIEMIKPAFTEVGENIINDKILACFSTNNDLRMYSQQAAFTVHNTTKKLIDFKDFLYKIIIPISKIKYFKSTIRTLGITEKFVFPDLEHIAKDILNRYVT